MFGFGVFPALLQLIAMLVTPESPKYLMKIKENEKATIIFSTIL